MAYTYADFEKALNDSGMNGQFSDSDLSIAQQRPEYGLSLISLRRDLNNATTNEQKLLATEAENQLRKSYGSFLTPQTTTALSTTANAANDTPYSTGLATPSARAAAMPETTTQGSAVQGGAGKALSAAVDSAAGTELPSPESLTSDYARILDRAVNGQQGFTFDPFTDERYVAYKKAYNREGDRAAANALGAAAAATGGRPSSYATTAAQEANNYYAAKLADIIPTLYSEARDDYNQDFSMLMQQLNAAYQQERDKINDEQQDLANALTIYQTTKKLVEPLKSLIEAQTATKSGGSGGSGSKSGGKDYAAYYINGRPVYTGGAGSTSGADSASSGAGSSVGASSGFRDGGDGADTIKR